MAVWWEQVGSTLEAFGVDQHTIDEVLSMLQRSQEAVDQGKVRTNADGAFGPSAAGQTLSWDAGVAHAKVAEAMADMVDGLGGYAENIRRFRDDALGTDEEAAGALGSLRAATERLTTPTIAAAADTAGGADS